MEQCANIMSNPFSKLTLADALAHNRKVELGRKPLQVHTPASLMADKREGETQKKATQLIAANGQGSHLEQKFEQLWAEVGGPKLEAEFRFHPTRRWRADFCHAPSRTLIEIEGGVWGGRHTRGGGFLGDSEKYLAAFLLGFSVVRLTAPQLTREILAAVLGRIAPNTRGTPANIG